MGRQTGRTGAGLRPGLRRRYLEFRARSRRATRSRSSPSTPCGRPRASSSRSARCSTASAWRAARRRKSPKRCPPSEPVVVFGVRPCDGRAMVRNDKVFTCGPCDPYYQTRRDQVVFVGLACATPPSPNCFCTSVGGSPHAEDGLDILMTELDGRYHREGRSRREAESSIDCAPALFEKATAADSDEADAAHAAAPFRIRSVRWRPWSRWPRASSAISTRRSGKSWPAPASAAASAPTCARAAIASTSTTKSPASRPCAASACGRGTTASSPTSPCTPPATTRATRPGARLRQRVCHKLLYFVENHNMQQCTGCGRCITHCPVGIDIVKVANVMEEGAGA